ncbi:hypothetical protein HZA44_02100 [Candidatus Peregrinibacteria bacterium]|nr:hypothetical protein [Candidatus Peregrinibacteria bacterium]
MKIKILDTPYHLSLLATLGRPDVFQPQISQLVESLYVDMFGAVMDEELEQEKVKIKTRIFKKEPKEGFFTGSVLKRKQHVVVADVLRAGMQPANLFYLKLCSLLDPRFVRQDHIMSQRADAPTGVTHSNLLGSKIGGTIKNRIVFIPDPMGATGNSATEVIQHYLKHYGTPKKFVLVNLVITPFYLEKLKSLKADIRVYAARLDRKLTRDSFIVPGLGGVGEMINNTKK